MNKWEEDEEPEVFDPESDIPYRWEIKKHWKSLVLGTGILMFSIGLMATVWP